MIAVGFVESKSSAFQLLIVRGQTTQTLLTQKTYAKTLEESNSTLSRIASDMIRHTRYDFLLQLRSDKYQVLPPKELLSRSHR